MTEGAGRPTGGKRLRGLHFNPSLPKGRIEAYSDGVFAIVVTLLVLDLHLPRPEGGSTHLNLGAALLAQAPNIASFVLSFLITTVYWVNHHQLFVAIERADRNFLWINSVFLMTVSISPFPTAVLGAYPREPVAAILFGGANLFVAGGFWAMRWYASFRGHLMHERVTDDMRRQAFKRGLAAPVLYIAGIVLAYVNVWLSWACYLAMPIYYFLPAQFESHTAGDTAKAPAID